MDKVILISIMALVLGGCGARETAKENERTSYEPVEIELSSNREVKEEPTQGQKRAADKYIEELVSADIGIYAGEITDANFLILAVDAYPGANFDIYAETYLEDAISNGLTISGVYIVDIKNCQFGDGWVTGDRIGKAYR